jgi:cation diffusion facilitator family transporter
MTTIADEFPPDIRDAMRGAERLQWWKIGWTVSIVAVMGLTMGQSQTMKTAWVEDLVSLVPSVAFLVAARMERRGARSKRFPFGFERANGLGFFLAAVALAATGALLLYDSVMTLVHVEHATVGSVRLLGHDIWLGWLMLAAQLYALVPPLIIGRKELPLAETLSDKLVHTDALMNKANWMTGAAGIAGVVGLGLGWWWADSVAAAVISLDIINDGVKALRSSTAELIDSAPRALSSPDLSDDAQALKARLQARYPAADIRLRETGRRIHAEVHGAAGPQEPIDAPDLWPAGEERLWRLAQIAFVPPRREVEAGRG